MAEYRLDEYDAEAALLNGRIRRTWPRELKFEVIGEAMDGTAVGMVCRITKGNKLRIITVYEDTAKNA